MRSNGAIVTRCFGGTSERSTGVRSGLLSTVLLAAFLCGRRPDRRPPIAGRTSAASAVVLSNESTFTRWAHPRGRGGRSAPSRRPPLAAVGSLHMLTEEGLPEVYLLLDQVTPAHGPGMGAAEAPGAAQRQRPAGFRARRSARST